MSYHPIAIFVTVLCVAGCSSSPSEGEPDAAMPEDTAVQMDMEREEIGMDAAETGPSCTRLFGEPVEKTGLSDSECRPICEACGGAAPVEFTMDDLAALRSLELVEPPADLADDPYDMESPPQPRPGAACGVLFDTESTYRLQTFDGASALRDAGAALTHHGACGVCSTLEDLAAYAGNDDLTGPVRECGLLGAREGEQANIDCLLDLGFTLPCARIWYFNTRNTREACLEPCLAALNDPYHLEDGSLNACLQCDEDESGPVFKAVAGRTRRNSGLPSAICRPCDTVRPVPHDYPR